MEPHEHRVEFDFEIEFSNGGGLQGQGFRLDIDGEEIADDELAAYIVRDLGLLMVGDVRIRNKRILRERHKRRDGAAAAAAASGVRIDRSHTIEHAMITYRGLPAPIVCDFLSREASRGQYAPGTEFQFGQISLCSNTGTYVDSPLHRYPTAPTSRSCRSTGSPTSRRSPSTSPDPSGIATAISRLASITKTSTSLTGAVSGSNQFVIHVV
jgi:hypothetical protein